MKNIVEIEQAHDLVQNLIQNNSVKLKPYEVDFLKASLSSICWALGHSDDGPFADLIKRLKMIQNEKHN